MRAIFALYKNTHSHNHGTQIQGAWVMLLA
jgi:hypothetical protein